MSQETFEFVRRAEALSDDDYLVEFDQYLRPSDGAQMLIAHIGVRRWAPSVLKRMRREWKTFRALCDVDVYAYPLHDGRKWRKFVTSLGFSFLRNVNCNDGIARPLYLSRVNDAFVPNDQLQLDQQRHVEQHGDNGA